MSTTRCERRESDDGSQCTARAFGAAKAHFYGARWVDLCATHLDMARDDGFEIEGERGRSQGRRRPRSGATIIASGRYLVDFIRRVSS